MWIKKKVEFTPLDLVENFFVVPEDTGEGIDLERLFFKLKFKDVSLILLLYVGFSWEEIVDVLDYKKCGYNGKGNYYQAHFRLKNNLKKAIKEDI